jgi:hypothetical protein
MHIHGRWLDTGVELLRARMLPLHPTEQYAD